MIRFFAFDLLQDFRLLRVGLLRLFRDVDQTGVHRARPPLQRPLVVQVGRRVRRAMLLERAMIEVLISNAGVARM